MYDVASISRWVVEVLILASMIAIYFLVRKYLAEYTIQKGKNLATREDIASITHEIEAAKLEYTAQIEELKDKLEQGRATSHVYRERVAITLSNALSAYTDLAVTLSMTQRRAWYETVDISVAEERCLTSIENFAANVNILLFLNAIPPDFAKNALLLTRKTERAWDRLFAQMVERRRMASDPNTDKDDWHDISKKEIDRAEKLRDAHSELANAAAMLASQTSYDSRLRE